MIPSLPMCTPEELGIHSSVIEGLLDKLTECETEPHGLMVMRYGKLCFSGWWKPYVPQLQHGLQSLTKTFSGTAIGMLITEGKLSLDTKVISLFPEKIPADASNNLLRITVRDVLCMGTGMETAAPASEHWIEDFFRTPVPNTPGTAFFYNNPGSNLLAAIVKRISGKPMMQFLEEKLFPYIGVETGSIACLTLPDGTEVGGGGMYARLEDCMRLMLLYMNYGVAENKRILSREWVEFATSCQNGAPNPAGIRDCQQGYGFQMWQCSYPGAYRADGALGQYVVCFPAQNLMIGILETASYPTGVQQVLDAIFSVVPLLEDRVLPNDPIAFGRLSARAKMLRLPVPFPERNDNFAEPATGCYHLIDGKIPWMPEVVSFVTGKDFPGIRDLVLRKNEKWALTLNTSQGNFTLSFAADGSMSTVELPGMFPYDLAYVQACICAPNTLVAAIRYIKTCYEVQLRLRTEGNLLHVETSMNDMKKVHEYAVALRCNEGEIVG